MSQCPQTPTPAALSVLSRFIAFQLSVIVLGFCIVAVVGWGLVLSASVGAYTESEAGGPADNATDSAAH
jgi:ABC-type nickel/cobalt efflux system permease component RcnA